MRTCHPIAALIAELSQVLSTLDPPVRPQLQAPAGIERIRAAEDQLGIRFPDELLALLSCHNGQIPFSDDAYSDPIVPSLRQPTGIHSYYWLAGVDEIVENTRHLREEYAEYLKGQDFAIFGPTRHHDRFLVFTATENADWLVLDLDPDTEGTFGQVVMHCTQPYELVVVADSIASFLQMLIDGYTSGRFRFYSDLYFVLYGDA